MKREDTVYLGELDLGGYPVVCISHWKTRCEALLLAAWLDYVRKSKPDISGMEPINTFNDLCEEKGASIRPIPLDEVVWP